jgi:hypothetical protein
VISQNQARATSEEALAVSVLETAAQNALGDMAGGLFRVQSVAAPTGVSVRLALLGRVSVGTGEAATFKESGILIDIIPDGLTYRSRVAVKADQFVITDGSILKFPFVFEGGVAYMDTAMIRNLTAVNITAGAITTEKLATGAVTAEKITAGAITATEINATSVRAAVLTANSIKTGMLTARNITTDKIAVNGVYTDNILIDQVTKMGWSETGSVETLSGTIVRHQSSIVYTEGAVSGGAKFTVNCQTATSSFMQIFFEALAPGSGSWAIVTGLGLTTNNTLVNDYTFNFVHKPSGAGTWTYRLRFVKYSGDNFTLGHTSCLTLYHQR